jgi:hypothetical protein
MVVAYTFQATAEEFMSHAVALDMVSFCCVLKRLKRNRIRLSDQSNATVNPEPASKTIDQHTSSAAYAPVLLSLEYWGTWIDEGIPPVGRALAYVRRWRTGGCGHESPR